MAEELATVDTEAEADVYKYKTYTQKYLTNLAKDVANETISTEYEDNPDFKAMMDQKKLQFEIQKQNQEHQRWLADHMLDKEEFAYKKLQDAKVDAANQPAVNNQAAPTNANNAQNVAPQNTSGWSFSDAFRQARKDFGNRPGGVFEWRGKLYQTNYQNEPFVRNPTPVYPGANQ
jgi:hypothetical protein